MMMSEPKKYKHVYKAGKKWQVRVKYRGDVVYVGVYDDPKVGAMAADREVLNRGWPKPLNFPPSSVPKEAPKPSAVGRINYKAQPKSSNKHGLKGVFNIGSFYCVQVWKDNVLYRLPERFRDKESAARAFDLAAVQLGRDASYLNYPEDFAKYKQDALNSRPPVRSRVKRGRKETKPSNAEYERATQVKRMCI